MSHSNGVIFYTNLSRICALAGVLLAFSALIAAVGAASAHAGEPLIAAPQVSQGTPLPFSRPATGLQVSDLLQLTAKEAKPWYQDGIWPLLGSALGTTLASVVPITVVYLQSSKALKTAQKQRQTDRVSASLAEFYNPLYALMTLNREIFERAGPAVKFDDFSAQQAAAEIWQELKGKVILNNQEIERILRTKTHLLSAGDSMERYNELYVHVSMFEVFQKVPTDLYSNFRFPVDILPHVERMRETVIKDLVYLTKGTN